VQLKETTENQFPTLKERTRLYVEFLEALSMADNFDEIEALKETHHDTLERFRKDPEVLGLNQFELITEAIEERRNEIVEHLTR